MALKYRKFQVKVPGKIILHGEHSVVYGKGAIAGAIGLESTFDFMETGCECVHFDTPSFDFHCEIDRQVMNKFILESKAYAKDHDTLTIAVQKFIDENVDQSKTKSCGKNLLALLTILALAANDCKDFEFKCGFRVCCDTEISVGAGLGSSAAFGVGYAAVFYIYLNDIRDYRELSCSKNFFDTISNLAFTSEKIMHGNPSGLDNTICTFGNMVKFSKGKEPEFFGTGVELNILLVDTKVMRSTKALVERVGEDKKKFPELYDAILNSIDLVVTDAVKRLKRMEEESDCYDEELKNLERLFSVNNNLLRALDVSHESLEQIFMISAKHGFSSKLTGAGGGGYAIILLPRYHAELPMYEALCTDLTASGFEWTKTTVGGPGLKIVEHAYPSEEPEVL